MPACRLTWTPRTAPLCSTPLRDSVNLAAAILMVFFFAVTVLAYVPHGALRDTDNQLRRPHQLGKRTIPAGAMVAFMTALALVDLGSFGVILGGFLARP
jgi:hypothetical protein